MASVTTIGFKEFVNKLNNLPREIRDEADAHVEDAGLEWEERAKNDAPVDTGFLRQNISAVRTGDMQSEVTSRMDYSPYVEWGTGTRVSVPADLSKYAAQFKGKKAVVGRYPKPFFFIQRPFVERKLIESLKRMLGRSR